jgi:hypothetical protein
VNKKELDMEFKVQAGDTIRAYDFKPMLGRGDCYLEGVVETVNDRTMGFQAYKIRVTADTWDGVELKGTQGVRVGQTVFVPWVVSFNEFQGRVINLSR